jgi:hypothetical protein
MSPAKHKRIYRKTEAKEEEKKMLLTLEKRD